MGRPVNSKSACMPKGDLLTNTERLASFHDRKLFNEAIHVDFRILSLFTRSQHCMKVLRQVLTNCRIILQYPKDVGVSSFNYPNQITHDGGPACQVGATMQRSQKSNGLGHFENTPLIRLGVAGYGQSLKHRGKQVRRIFLDVAGSHILTYQPSQTMNDKNNRYVVLTQISCTRPFTSIILTVPVSSHMFTIPASIFLAWCLIRFCPADPSTCTTSASHPQADIRAFFRSVARKRLDHGAVAPGAVHVEI